MATCTTPNGIVSEALTPDNYDDWSILAKNYLMSEDLWVGVIEDNTQIPQNSSELQRQIQTPENASERRKKNAKALHIIQMSCGSETFSQIKDTKTAKGAWNTLASLYKSRLGANADIEQGLPSLHRSVQRGDMDTARTFANNNRKAMYETSKMGKTVLHVAVLTGQEDMVEKLVNKVPKRLLVERDTRGYTALALAAELSDTISIAKCMVKRNGDLLTIKTNEGLLPVVIAAVKGNQNMANYLYHETLTLHKEELFKDNDHTSALLLTRCITSQIFDVALDLLKRNPRVPLTKKFDGVSPLYALAQQPSVFPSVVPSKFWLWRWIYKGRLFGHRSITKLLLALPGIKKIYKKKMTHHRTVEILNRMAKAIMGFDEAKLKEASVYESLLEASKTGIVEFITILTVANPDLYWVIDENKRGIFSYAVLYRREKIFNLINGLKGQGKVIISRTDIFGNNMLHLTGILAPAAELDRKSGPALQMQRELQWFMAVKRILHPKFQLAVNGDGMKPRELFTKKHEELLKDAETWAKETANSFTIVGALIITIVFAAAFTLPGGNDQNTGIPLFLHKKMFTVYMVADAISLFASSTSVMTFIGILTSRNAERDFLKSLPLKLMLGLFTLICSVLAMIVAFCSAFSLVLRDHGHFKIVKFLISIASLSVVVFLPGQLRLLLEIFNSTFRSDILNTKKI
ncbi:protein ACCELERATED CELL DEATH 6-like [Abrus precatorius]|uniref:Protein ACCELERATED CELL DEATH 6-like n=1 Tax=Abrus precatorius TaxID=3816 RepID=A0A8B8MIN5_ABRPR|nr:protein ACCELERATED CELL DEATH 6-like [Abrus precatorius]